MTLYLFSLNLLENNIKINLDTKKIDNLNLIVKGRDTKSKYNDCYISSYNSDIKILHLIITRFLIKFYRLNGFPKKLDNKAYIQNGIRVMNKYLFPSLNNQRCKNFIWILMIGNEANISQVKSLIDLNNSNNSFESKILYQRNLKYFIKDKAKYFDILITTRIDYDDCIYYDAVNDVRKIIDINKPVILHGYNTGLYYFESTDKYYYYHYENNEGVWSVFASLILVLNKVNDTFTVYDLDNHCTIKKTLLKSYKSFGINELNYDPAIFDNGDPKFVWVRQKYSGASDYTEKIINNLKYNKINFNLNEFYGK